jgi:hypothetical protein
MSNGKEFENVKGVVPGDAALAQRDERADLVRPEMQQQSVDAARVSSEVQAMILMARSRPRDYLDIKRAIRAACSRPRLAEKATYNYPRGGTNVTGPSIRLMEMLVGAFQNVDSGWRVLEIVENRVRVESYAWDLENNVKKRIEFWVQMSRDTKQGVVPVTAERDKYEVVASAAQRRLRACIANILPFDLVDEALEICEQTVKAGDGSKPMVDRIAEMVFAFEELGVSRTMLETLLKHPVEQVIADELPRLRGIWTAINEGHAQREEFFKPAVTVSNLAGPSDEAQRLRNKPTGTPTTEQQQPHEGVQDETRDAPNSSPNITTSGTAPTNPSEEEGATPTEPPPKEEQEAAQAGTEEAKDSNSVGNSDPLPNHPAVDAMKQAEDFVATRRKASSKAQEAARRALEGQQELGGNLKK